MATVSSLIGRKVGLTMARMRSCRSCDLSGPRHRKISEWALGPCSSSRRDGRGKQFQSSLLDSYAPVVLPLTWRWRSGLDQWYVSGMGYGSAVKSAVARLRYPHGHPSIRNISVQIIMCCWSSRSVVRVCGPWCIVDMLGNASIMVVLMVVPWRLVMILSDVVSWE